MPTVSFTIGGKEFSLKPEQVLCHAHLSPSLPPSLPLPPSLVLSLPSSSLCVFLPCSFALYPTAILSLSPSPLYLPIFCPLLFSLTFSLSIFPCLLSLSLSTSHLSTLSLFVSLPSLPFSSLSLSLSLSLSHILMCTGILLISLLCIFHCITIYFSVFLHYDCLSLTFSFLSYSFLLSLLS